MTEMKLGRNLVKYRKGAGITQEQLAEYMGVSKSSVSKWETGYAYPDICFLPQLAALFDVSVDALLGYEPQLEKTEIRRLYHELKRKFIKDPEQALKESRELIKKYYSCFPFLYQMAVLYVNHFGLCKDREKIIEEALHLCRRVKKESECSALVKEAHELEAQILLAKGDFGGVLELLGDEVRPLSTEGELIGISQQSLGNREKAEECMQICIYQHLLFLLQDSVQYMAAHLEEKELCRETMKRISIVAEAYQIERLHFYTAVQIYINAGLWEAMEGSEEAAEEWLEKAVGAMEKAKAGHGFCLHGDSYFDRVDGWIENLDLGEMAPVGESTLKHGLEAVILNQPAFSELKERPRVKRVLERLRAL